MSATKYLLMGAAAMLLGGAAQAVVVPDASFETPVQNGSFTYTPTVAGVTFNAGSGIQGNGSAWGFAAAPDGAQTAFLQSTGSYAGAISFALSDLTVGQVYRVVFAAAARPTYADLPFTVSIAGSQIGSYDVTASAWADYATNSFTAAATTATLTFQSASLSGDHDVGLDNVRVSAVPEPAGWAMMIGGFGALGFTMRRNRKRGAALG